MNPRSTRAKCPCGSGLTGLRNLTESCVGYVSCRKCQIIAPPKEYQKSYDQQAKRNSAARRLMEERRDLEAIR